MIAVLRQKSIGLSSYTPAHISTIARARKLDGPRVCQPLIVHDLAPDSRRPDRTTAGIPSLFELTGRVAPSEFSEDESRYPR